jgi:hypothetical protein
MRHGTPVMAVIRLLMPENSGLIAILVIISHSAKGATKEIRHIFINSQDRKYRFKISRLRTIKT